MDPNRNHFHRPVRTECFRGGFNQPRCDWLISGCTSGTSWEGAETELGLETRYHFSWFLVIV